MTPPEAGALATSDSRHHALAPGAVRRTQDTETSPATMRQSPPANGKNRGKPSSTGSPSPDEVVADGFMRMDPGQAKHETAQTCEGPYPQGLPLAECGLLGCTQLSRKRRWVRSSDEKAASRASASAAATAAAATAYVAAALACMPTLSQKIDTSRCLHAISATDFSPPPDPPALPADDHHT